MNATICPSASPWPGVCCCRQIYAVRHGLVLRPEDHSDYCLKRRTADRPALLAEA